MKSVQKKLVKAVQAEFDRVSRDLVRRSPPAMLTINAAQNTLRTCLEAVLNKALPYDGQFLVEVAIRLASYAISAAPIEDQEVLAYQFIRAFADAHMRRISEGKVISSEWEMKDGRRQQNFPEARR